MKQYFKRPNGAREPFNYYEVGPTKYLMVNFLNVAPLVVVFHDQVGSLTGSKCIREVGIPISRAEFQQAFDKAISNPQTQMI